VTGNEYSKGCSENTRQSLLVNIKEYEQQFNEDTAAALTDETTNTAPQVLPLPHLVNCCKTSGDALEVKMSRQWFRTTYMLDTRMGSKWAEEPPRRRIQHFIQRSNKKYQMNGECSKHRDKKCIQTFGPKI
jgi:hypothetical protein